MRSGTVIELMLPRRGPALVLLSETLGISNITAPLRHQPNSSMFPVDNRELAFRVKAASRNKNLSAKKDSLVLQAANQKVRGYHKHCKAILRSMV